MTNEYPFVYKCSKHVNDHEYKFHCSICNVYLSCAQGRICDVKEHVGRDKAEKINQDSKFKHFYVNLTIHFSLTNQHKICFIDNNVS